MDTETRLNQARQSVRQSKLADESEVVRDLLSQFDLDDKARGRIVARATELVEGVRANRRRFGNLDSFLGEYGLSTPEGYSGLRADIAGESQGLARLA